MEDNWISAWLMKWPGYWLAEVEKRRLCERPSFGDACHTFGDSVGCWVQAEYL